MTDKISKALRKLSQPEMIWLADILAKISSSQTAGMDLKKLKGYANIFRVRKGKLRIVYQLDKAGHPLLISIERRNDNTYHFK